MWKVIKHMVVKEFIQTLRDKRMRFLIFGAPILQLLLFGYAVTTDVKDISTAVYDLDRTQQSREFISQFSNSGYFRINYYLSSESEAVQLLDSGDATIVIQIEAGFSKQIKRNETATIQMILDGTDSNLATVALNYANGIITRYTSEILLNRVNLQTSYSVMSDGESPVVKFGSVAVETRAWYNPDLKSKNYNVPGVIALLLTVVTLLLTSMAVVREREIGTMEQVIVTPIRPIEFILGKTVPFAILGFLDVLLITTVAVFWFEVAIQGSLLLLLFAAFLYLLTMLGIGLFISTVSQTQQQAMMTTFFFMYPIILLSGFMFPIESMPKFFQLVTHINPLKYFLIIIRGIFLKGNDIHILWKQLVPLAIFGITILTLSSIRFRKRLE